MQLHCVFVPVTDVHVVAEAVIDYIRERIIGIRSEPLVFIVEFIGANAERRLIHRSFGYLQNDIDATVFNGVKCFVARVELIASREVVAVVVCADESR